MFSKQNLNLYIQFLLLEVEVKVLEIGDTPVKYKYLEIVLKYSTWVNVLSYFLPPQQKRKRPKRKPPTTYLWEQWKERGTRTEASNSTETPYPLNYDDETPLRRIRRKMLRRASNCRLCKTRLCNGGKKTKPAKELAAPKGLTAEKSITETLLWPNNLALG